MFKIILTLFLSVFLFSCGGSDKFKNPPADDGQASAGDESRIDGTPTENAPEEKKKEPNPVTDNSNTNDNVSIIDTSDDSGFNRDDYTSVGIEPYDPCDDNQCPPVDDGVWGPPLPGGSSAQPVGGLKHAK